MTWTGERRELVPQLTLAGMADLVIRDDEKLARAGHHLVAEQRYEK
jgi:hypothetical protein